MIRILLGILASVSLCCTGSLDSKMEMEKAARSIVGSHPAKSLHLIELDPAFAALTFESSPDEALSWIYKWPVTSAKFEHLDFESFLNESSKLLAAQKFVMFANNSVEHSTGNTKNRYSVECVIKFNSESTVICEIKCSKL